MARGKGYTGEGDILTAVLLGAISSVYRESTFTEMFCPDWKEDRIFLIHMGEANIDLLDDAMLTEKELPFLKIPKTIISTGRFKQRKW